MNLKSLFLVFLVFTLTLSKSLANDPSQKKTLYVYKDREHSTHETLTKVSILYALGWASYIFQPTAFKEGSFKTYGRNFGKLVFDKDTPYWNWYIHPYSGSQLYLFFRANGYSRLESFKLTFLQSTLFEFFTEIYTEPASIQDLYQTPVLGSLVGVGIENLSLYLLNSPSVLANFFGHLLNPMTLFWFYEGQMQITPDIDPHGDKVGLRFYYEF